MLRRRLNENGSIGVISQFGLRTVYAQSLDGVALDPDINLQFLNLPLQLISLSPDLLQFFFQFLDLSFGEAPVVEILVATVLQIFG